MITLSLAWTYPEFNPIAFSIGPFPVRWYGLMYIIGIFSGWKIGSYLLTTYKNGLTVKNLDDSLLYLVLGLVIGGRLGNVLFYTPHMFVDNPMEVFKTWHGGMSFHGGILGVIILSLFFAWRQNINFFKLTDIYTCVLPLGVFFGRLGNFINGELWGRVTNKPWGMVFPHGGPELRHPSQLYEALFEGIFLFVIMMLCWTKTDMRLKPGRISGVFAIGYSAARLFCECYREPEILVAGPLTMGQLLTIPLLGFGWYLIRRPVAAIQNDAPKSV